MAKQVENALTEQPNNNENGQDDEQGNTALACGHKCIVYKGMPTDASSCWSKRSTECCECMHTAADETCRIYIDILGEQPCSRWQFYCAVCIQRCAPAMATMWDAGKMARVPVFEPGTLQGALLKTVTPKAVTQTAAASQAAAAAAAAPAAWLSVARQTLQAVRAAEHVELAVAPVAPAEREWALATTREGAVRAPLGCSGGAERVQRGYRYRWRDGRVVSWSCRWCNAENGAEVARCETHARPMRDPCELYARCAPWPSRPRPRLHSRPPRP